MTLLEHGRPVADGWTVIGDDAPLPQGTPAIVSLTRYRREAAVLAGRNAPVGVLVEGAQAADDLADIVAADVSLICVRFAVFRDGRGFSVARALRQRHGFKGVLRAVGHVLPDQHVFLLRCGFDEVAVEREADLPSWLSALEAFHFAYQPAALDEAAGGGLRRLRPGHAGPGEAHAVGDQPRGQTGVV